MVLISTAGLHKRGDRPLLQNGDPLTTMKRLIDERYPVYAQADISIESVEGPHEAVVETIIGKLKEFRGSVDGESHD